MDDYELSDSYIITEVPLTNSSLSLPGSYKAYCVGYNNSADSLSDIWSTEEVDNSKIVDCTTHYLCYSKKLIPVAIAYYTESTEKDNGTDWNKIVNNPGFVIPLILIGIFILSSIMMWRYILCFKPQKAKRVAGQ